VDDEVAVLLPSLCEPGVRRDVTRLTRWFDGSVRAAGAAATPLVQLVELLSSLVTLGGSPVSPSWRGSEDAFPDDEEAEAEIDRGPALAASLCPVAGFFGVLLPVLFSSGEDGWMLLGLLGILGVLVGIGIGLDSAFTGIRTRDRRLGVLGLSAIVLSVLAVVAGVALGMVSAMACRGSDLAPPARSGCAGAI
jgi:hypothetical protein